MEWAHTEIDNLHSLILQFGVKNINYIANELGRTKNAVLTATKKMISQQLVHHSASDVARNYGMTEEELSCFIGHRKYYVPLVNDKLPASIYIVCGLIVTCGIARFGQVLAHSPLWT